jgi:hypothetical protein
MTPPVHLAFSDSKAYDRERFGRASDDRGVVVQHHDVRLTAGTASAAKDAQAVCVFVNDRLAS